MGLFEVQKSLICTRNASVIPPFNYLPALPVVSSNFHVKYFEPTPSDYLDPEAASAFAMTLVYINTQAALNQVDNTHPEEQGNISTRSSVVLGVVKSPTETESKDVAVLVTTTVTLNPKENIAVSSHQVEMVGLNSKVKGTSTSDDLTTNTHTVETPKSSTNDHDSSSSSDGAHKKHRFLFKLFSFSHDDVKDSKGSKPPSPKTGKKLSNEDKSSSSKEITPKLERSGSTKTLDGSEGEQSSSHHAELKKIFSKQMISQVFHLTGHPSRQSSEESLQTIEDLKVTSRKPSAADINKDVTSGEDSDSSIQNHGGEIKKSKSILGPIKEFMSSPRSKRKNQNAGQQETPSSAHEEPHSLGSATEPKLTPFEPTTMDQYHMMGTKVIGKGAGGVVRLAKKHTGERVFAIKEFRKKKKDESYREYIKKLTSEFCIGSMLHHANVVETLDIIRDGNHWYEVMEYCQGGDLYSIVRSGQLTNIEIDCCFKQLIRGVLYLHSVGVAHRDLKPENLLIDKSGRLKITDFGVSDVFRVCWERKPHLSKGICGSTPYIAPEEFLEGEYDARQVDVWACGIIYYAMVFRGIPWEIATTKDSNYQYFLEHRGVEYEPLVRLPNGAQHLMFKILEPDPAKRITVSDILDDPWFMKIETCQDVKPPSTEHNHLVEDFENSVHK